MSKLNSLMLLFLAGLLLLVGGWYGCQQPAEPDPNEPPSVTIANVPVEGDTLFALVNLQWDGGDNDGYVVGFEYRYHTTHISTGETVTTDWIFTPNTSETIAFNSSDELNEQVFEIRAVDNDSARTLPDSIPTKNFYTIKAVPPEVEILTPANKQELFVADQTSDWWQGIEFQFTGSDEDGEIVEYGWAIDDADWTWTQDTSLYIQPSDVPGELAGEHIIRLTARDNTDIVNQRGDSIRVEFVRASFEKDILIIDDTRESDLPSSVEARSDSVVDAFYREVFGADAEWDYYSNDLRGNPVPPRSMLGQYKMLIWHADARPTERPHNFPKHIEYLENYMNLGGDLVLSGWRVLKSFAFGESFPKSFSDTSFVKKYLHIANADESPYYPGEFEGTTGTFGFSRLNVDSTKLDVFPYNGYLSNINTMPPPRASFTDVLYQYRPKPNADNIKYSGQACALLYTGTSFNAVVLGFPLYFMTRESAETLADEVLTTLGYR